MPDSPQAPRRQFVRALGGLAAGGAGNRRPGLAARDRRRPLSTDAVGRRRGARLHARQDELGLRCRDDDHGAAPRSGGRGIRIDRGV